MARMILELKKIESEPFKYGYDDASTEIRIQYFRKPPSVLLR